MAAQIRTIRLHVASSRTKRPGVTAKAKTSKNKSSKLYKKAYAGQGR